jgi:hypothetical protein
MENKYIEKRIAGELKTGRGLMRRISAEWQPSICHSFLGNSIKLNPIVECRYRIADADENEINCEYIKAVHRNFAPWIDSTVEECFNHHKDFVYVRIDARRINSGNLLGILNCFRGIEEQGFIAYNYHVVKQEFSDLNDAQALVLGWVTHPQSFPAYVYNYNHAIWLGENVRNLSKLLDFSFFDTNTKRFGSSHNLAISRNSGLFFTNYHADGVWTSFRSMLPDECYSQDTEGIKKGPYGNTIPMLLCKETVDYFLNSNPETLGAVKYHEKLACAW